MGPKKKNKKNPTHPGLLLEHIQIWIFICLQVLTSGYIVSHILKDISTSTNKHQVLDKTLSMTNTFFFFRKALYIHVASCRKVYIFPSHAEKPICSKNPQTETHTAWLRLYGLYIVCSEQKNASQKPSVVVYNIGCQKGFI